MLAQLSVTSAFAQKTPTVTMQQVPSNEVRLSEVEMKNAKPMTNLVKIAPTGKAAKMLPAMLGTPGVSKRFKTGVGEKQSAQGRGSANVAPRNYGTSLHPYTQTRVATNMNNLNLAAVYPYRPTGKLYFRTLSGVTTWCSASALESRVIVTAAHCVAAFGRNRYYSNFTFAPARTNSTNPLGVWTPVRVAVLPSWLNGTDLCSVRGVVCRNDVAVLVLRDNNGRRIGDETGFYQYGWDGYGYKPFLGYQLNQVTQLGYPGGLDSGEIMQRNDSLAYIDVSSQLNQIIGSRMDRGSSGGPWLTNFEYPSPRLTGAGLGQLGRDALVVTGVTSWGNDNNTFQQVGASPFTSSNIVPLMNAACAAAAGNC
jgi:hypothetical protein